MDKEARSSRRNVSRLTRGDDVMSGGMREEEKKEKKKERGKEREREREKGQI